MLLSIIGLTGMISVIVVVITNIIFMSLDVVYLKESGKQIEGRVWLGVILVLLYLIVRESKTNKNAIPTIAWFVLFFLDLFV